MQAKWYLIVRFSTVMSRIFSLQEVAEIFINLFVYQYWQPKQKSKKEVHTISGFVFALLRILFNPSMTNLWRLH